MKLFSSKLINGDLKLVVICMKTKRTIKILVCLMIQYRILSHIRCLWIIQWLYHVKNNITAQIKNRTIISVEIVRYMVKNTLEPLCKGKMPQEILRLKIADIACGSVFNFSTSASDTKELPHLILSSNSGNIGLLLITDGSIW